jgi:hypothetical protein
MQFAFWIHNQESARHFGQRRPGGCTARQRIDQAASKK